jgi:transcriptional regulator with XRE-family HTH domain
MLIGGNRMELKIKELLAKKGFSQRELAFALQVTDTIVSLWCNNKVVPSQRHLKQIAEFLKVDIKKLIK